MINAANANTARASFGLKWKDIAPPFAKRKTFLGHAATIRYAHRSEAKTPMDKNADDHGRLDRRWISFPSELKIIFVGRLP
jgi:regulator of RNase E activity RraA